MPTSNTQQQAQEGQKQIKAPELALPKGGGAIQGMGENFQPNGFSGTGSTAIPISLPEARGLGPTLALSYDSGAGNGPFGIGFTMVVPSIVRKTQLGRPHYNDQDTFILSGAEDLVKKRKQEEGKWIDCIRTATEEEIPYQITAYLPKVEGSFATIEQWVPTTDQGTTHWRVRTSNNVTSIYGKSPQAQISNPDASHQIFEWRIEASWDSKGNKVLYHYKAEDSANVDAQDSNQQAQKYLQSVQYGNYHVDGDPTQDEKFAYEVVLDYGEYRLEDLDRPGSNPYQAQGTWLPRQDPFSSYRSGFEVRTSRLCRNIMVFHHFEKELGPLPCLASVTRLHYEQTPILSFLIQVQQTGYRRADNGSYTHKSLPPVQFTYAKFDPQAPAFRHLTIAGGSALPGSLDQYLPVDLDGEGIPGFLLSNDTTTMYWSPEGAGTYAQPQVPSSFPIDKNMASSRVALVDVEGDGALELVVNDAQQSGFYRHQVNGSWVPFQSFESIPTDLTNPDREFVDLNGNGLASLVITEEAHLRVYPSQGVQGYGAPQLVDHEADLPHHNPDYQEEVITYTNLLGDGLSHKVKIRNGSVECWPSLGYGKFGKKITLKNAPHFGEQLDARRLHLADIDGSGTSDIVYVSDRALHVYINESGNAFSEPITVPLPAPYSDMDQISFADLLGKGTSCVVLTKMAPEVQHYYYDFGQGKPATNGNAQQETVFKPYLLTEMNNNLGAITKIQYCSATQFYLEDKKAGKKWATRLPFPVQVVAHVEHIDEISGTRLKQSYKYHEGYYDPQERRFRGFGLVESWDTETFEKFTQTFQDQHTTLEQLNEELYVPPVYTKTWYHNGAYVDSQAVSRQYAKEYYAGDDQAYTMPDSVLDARIDRQDARTMYQAYMTLNGQMLRQEVYALDGQSEAPYTVTESNFYIQQVQPRAENKYPVLFVMPRESISYAYERNPKDPRISHAFTLATDPYGHVTQACAVAYGRRPSTEPLQPQHQEQQTLKITAATTSFINHEESAQEPYRLLGIAHAQKAYQIHHAALPTQGAYYAWEAIKHQIDQALQNAIAYQAPVPDAQLCAELRSWHRSYFWNAEQTAAAPLGTLTAQALLHHQEDAVFSEELLQKLIINDQKVITPERLAAEGGYYQDAGYWWNHGLVQCYYTEKDHRFYLPHQVVNIPVQQPDLPAAVPSLHTQTTVAYDVYSLFPIATTQHLGEETQFTTRAQIDYQHLTATQLTDINGNVSQALFDPLGMVIATSAFKPAAGGRPAIGDGDLKAYQLKPGVTFDEVIDDTKAHAYLQKASSFYYYDLAAWMRDKQPPRWAQLVRETYVSDLKKGEKSRLQVHLGYSDGFGREIERKAKVDPGLAWVIDRQGNLKRDAAGKPVAATVAARWLVSGRTVYNNKGKATQQYLPYYINTPAYASQTDIAACVPPPTVVYYDPLLRPIRVTTPKGFFTKVSFSPWHVQHYDENDTVLDAAYYQDNYTKVDKDEKDALDKAAQAYNTPTTAVLDNQGNTFLSIQNNLGQVTAQAMPTRKGQATTQEGLYNALVKAGYLDSKGFVTAKFQPYQQGFSLQLPEQFTSFIAALMSLLKKSCLTAYSALDIEGRTVSAIDPRLYDSNCTQGTAYSNFVYQYGMGAQAPLWTQSADAGTVCHLNNVLGSQAWTFTERGYVQRIDYDQLQRKTDLWIRKDSQKENMQANGTFHLVETFTYGETQPEAAAKNLRGALYERKDLAGVVTNPAYSFVGELLATSRQMAQNYKTPLDWTQAVPLEEEIYTTQSHYNALQQKTTATTPDGAVTQYTYNRQGQLYAVQVKQPDGSVQPVVQSITYDAQGQREQLVYSNGVTTRYTYEESTQRLIGLKSTSGDAGNAKVHQDITYTYDPVGNMTRKYDASYKTIFNNNQAVAPLADYTYDALYRLLKANGRQHPSMSKATYGHNEKHQSLFTQLPSANDATSLEQYTERYTYDDAGNLIQKRHIADSGSWTQDTPVVAHANQLQEYTYDASGNQRQLEINSTVDLAFNCCENLVKAGIIQRPGELDDCDYYVYDSNEQRTRKVSERMEHNGSVTQIEEKVYLGHYEVKRQKSIDAQGKATTTLVRNTLRVMDDTRCVAIIHHWPQDDKHREVDQAGTRQVRWQLEDHLGSVALELDSAAKLISYEEYFPYGGTAIMAGKSQQEVKRKEYRYSGKERDDSTGLYYYGARYYIPWLGRWLNPDPAGTVNGLNLYAFVTDDPETYWDVGGRNLNDRLSRAKKDRLSRAKKAIDFAKVVAPYPGNQWFAVDITHGESTARLSVQRMVFEANNFEDFDYKSGNQAFRRAASVLHLGGAFCNEYSALTHTYLTTTTATQEPIVRMWSPEEGHAYTVIGDHRMKDSVMVDPWVEDPAPLLHGDAKVYNYDTEAPHPYIQTETPPVSEKEAKARYADLRGVFNEMSGAVVARDLRKVSVYSKMPKSLDLFPRDYRNLDYGNPEKHRVLMKALFPDQEMTIEGYYENLLRDRDANPRRRWIFEERTSRRDERPTRPSRQNRFRETTV